MQSTEIINTGAARAAGMAARRTKSQAAREFFFIVSTLS
jgi:hypothetical protein